MIAYGLINRKIIFDGDSLISLKVGSSATSADYNGHYVTSGTYNNCIAGRKISFTSLAYAGNTISNINSVFSTNTGLITSVGDIVIIQAATNDLGTLALTAAQAYSQLTTYCAAVKAKGAKVIVCTMAARDFTGDGTAMETKRLAYNSLITGTPSVYDALCDLGADAMFNTQAGCSNATNYQADKLHWMQPGSDRAITLLTSAITPIL